MHPVVDVIIPALNEEQSIGLVIEAIPKQVVRSIYVCDNGSQDATVEVSKAHGASVLHAKQRGYGSACKTGIQYLIDQGPNSYPDILVFIDGDYSDYPEELLKILKPFKDSDIDLVIGSRVLGNPEAGSLGLIQRFGNTLACFLIKMLYKYEYSDLGPFRAIRFAKLLQLKMEDPDYGWTVEMQIKAARSKMKFGEVPVSYRKRIGKSKISGTIKGIFGAASKILLTIFKTYVKG